MEAGQGAGVNQGTLEIETIGDALHIFIFEEK